MEDNKNTPKFNRKTVHLGPEKSASTDSLALLKTFLTILFLGLLVYISLIYSNSQIAEEAPVVPNELKEIVSTATAADKKRVFEEMSNAYKKTKSQAKVSLAAVKAEEVMQEEIITLDQIISAETSKYSGISKIDIKAIIEQESRYNPKVMRFEQKWQNKYGYLVKRKPNEPIKSWQLNFHSIGLMQIGYILHKDLCDLNSPKDLLDPIKNIACGVKKIAKCRETKSRVACIREYNGSGPMAEQYKNEILTRVARLKTYDKEI